MSGAKERSRDKLATEEDPLLANLLPMPTHAHLRLIAGSESNAIAASAEKHSLASS